jgi:hypothetical protein
MSIKKGQCIGGIRTIEDVRQRCYVNPETGCWHWRGSMKYGLPQASIGGNCVSVRRWVYAQGSPIVRKRTMIVPKCGHRDCVSPSCAVGKEGVNFSRWLVDQGYLHTPAHRQAIREASRSSRIAKLNPAKAVEIAKRVLAGEDRDRIAGEFGITRNHVNKVARGENWTEFVANAMHLMEAA